MENRFQYLLLITKIALASLLILTGYACAESSSSNKASDLNSEVFELGVAVGVINIADFTSEWTTGLSANFKATEDLFLQYNVFQAKASPSAYENNQGNLFDGSDRTFLHYDLLIGYNLFQGEFSPSDSGANLSSLYLVGGVGDTDFGGENRFTYTVGVGYQVALTRRLIARFDYRGYIYKSNLITDEDQTVTTTQMSSGLSFLF